MDCSSPWGPKETDTTEWLSLYAFFSEGVEMGGGGLKPPTCHWVKAICLAFNITLCSCDTFSSQLLKVLNTYQPIILTTAQLERVDSKYNPLDTQGLQSAWKSSVQLIWMLNAWAEYLCTGWKLLSNPYVASFFASGLLFNWEYIAEFKNTKLQTVIHGLT